MKDIKREDIIEVLKDDLEPIMEDVSESYSATEYPEGEELEYKPRSGFFPYTDGGYRYNFLTYANSLEGTGIDLPTKVLQDKVDEFSKRAEEYSQEQIWGDNKDEPEFTKIFPTKEDINYSDLEEFDSEYAEEFDDTIREYRDDESILFSLEAMYYNPENDRGEEGKHTIALAGSVNLEAPYHRRGFFEDFKEITFTFSSIEGLEKKLQKELEVIKSWFEGSDYKTSTTEIKQGRLEKGGETEKPKPATRKPINIKRSRDRRGGLRKMYGFAKGGKVNHFGVKDLSAEEHLHQADKQLRSFGTKLWDNKHPKKNKFIKIKEKFDDDVFFDVANTRELSELKYAKGGKLYDVMEYPSGSDFTVDEEDFKKLKSKKLIYADDETGWACNEDDYEEISELIGQEYEKGGEVKKKGNEMVIGGLAGILLGIFLNK